MADNSHIIILPDDPTLLTDDNRQMLHNPDFFTPHAPTAKTEFPLIELGTLQQYEENRKSIRQVCHAVDYQGSPIIIGAPGIDELHLPTIFSPIAGLAKMAAQIAYECGVLGKECIALVPKYEQRPFPFAFWHTDSGTVLLICSSDASTVFALPNLEANRNGQGSDLMSSHQYSPQKGQPVSFAGVIHTQPYCGTPDVERKNSGMILFFHLAAGERVVDIEKASPAVKKAYMTALNKPS